MNNLWISITVIYTICFVGCLFSAFMEVDHSFMGGIHSKWAFGVIALPVVTILYIGFWVWQITYWVLVK